MCTAERQVVCLPPPTACDPGMGSPLWISENRPVPFFPSSTMTLTKSRVHAAQSSPFILVAASMLGDLLTSISHRSDFSGIPEPLPPLSLTT